MCACVCFPVTSLHCEGLVGGLGSSLGCGSLAVGMSKHPSNAVDVFRIPPTGNGNLLDQSPNPTRGVETVNRSRVLGCCPLIDTRMFSCLDLSCPTPAQVGLVIMLSLCPTNIINAMDYLHLCCTKYMYICKKNT